jgi:hypothetical protein
VTGLDGKLRRRDAVSRKHDAKGQGPRIISLERMNMNIEVLVPEEWTPGQALVMRQLLQHGMRTGEPVIAFVRKDTSPDKLKEIYDQINTLIREAGLQVS